MVHQLITIAEYTDPDDTVWSVFDRKLEAALQAVEVAVSIRLRPEMGNGVELIRWLEGWNLRFRQQNKNLISIAENPAQQECLELSHPNLELIYISSINEIPKMLLKMSQRPTAVKRKHPVDRENNEYVPQPVQSARREAPSVPHTKAAIPAPAGTEHESPAESSSSPPQPENVTSVHQTQPLTTGTAPSDNPSHVDNSLHETRSFPNNASPDGNRAPLPSGLDWTGYNKTVGNSKLVSKHSIIEISGEYRCNSCGATRMFCKGDIVDKCENRECSSSSASFTLLFDLF